jgi:hypothetical protein
VASLIILPLAILKPATSFQFFLLLSQCRLSGGKIKTLSQVYVLDSSYLFTIHYVISRLHNHTVSFFSL